jgi:long-chain acyl-CoA synthetase
MRGYYRERSSPFVDDGWFPTGDIGRLDSDGYLWIVDRKNELFKTAGGKWVSPARVEVAIKRSPYVGQAVVLGAGRPHPVALIAPNWELVRRECQLPRDAGSQDIAANPAVRSRISDEVVRASAELAPYEQVRRVALLPRDLTFQDGELSPTLKVKRRIVEAKYAKLIESAYAGAEI